jgi:succinate dehydrogenase/fumarate reductase flavoprotein subunit
MKARNPVDVVVIGAGAAGTAAAVAAARNGVKVLLVDLHDPRGKSVDFTQISGGGYYDIPYRCLVPKGVDHLLVAGRCLSSTHLALGSVRCITGCFVTGEAAGTAAALSIKDRTSVREIRPSTLQERLREMGAMI